MIEEKARVVKIDNGDIWIEVQRQSVCGQCAASKGCGTAVLQKVLGNKRTIIRVLSEVTVNVDDEVIVGMDETAYLKGSFAVYFAPLILIFVFGMLGETLSEQLALTTGNATSIAFAVVGFILGLSWLRRFNAGISNDKRYQPVILSVVRGVDVRLNTSSRFPVMSGK